MKMKSIVGLFGAAALAAGSTAAHAIKMVDAADGDPADGARSVTYAKETLLKSAGEVTEVDDVTYYNIMRDHFVSGPADVEGALASDYYVSYVLNGMVFRTSLENTSLDGFEGDEDPDSPGSTTDNGAGFARHSGGAAGSDSVVFKLNQGNVTPKNWLVLTAQFAIAEAGSGGITRTISNTTLPTNVPGIKTTATHALPSAVKAVPALQETIEAATSVPDATAKHEFMSFSTSDDPTDLLAVSVGTIHLGVVGGGDGSAASVADPMKQYRDAQSVGSARCSRRKGGYAGRDRRCT